MPSTTASSLTGDKHPHPEAASSGTPWPLTVLFVGLYGCILTRAYCQMMGRRKANASQPNTPALWKLIPAVFVKLQERFYFEVRPHFV